MFNHLNNHKERGCKQASDASLTFFSQSFLTVFKLEVCLCHHVVYVDLTNCAICDKCVRSFVLESTLAY
jgi:hypothetical protein